jgi:hypothetical protein
MFPSIYFFGHGDHSGAFVDYKSAPPPISRATRFIRERKILTSKKKSDLRADAFGQGSKPELVQR